MPNAGIFCDSRVAPLINGKVAGRVELVRRKRASPTPCRIPSRCTRGERDLIGGVVFDVLEVSRFNGKNWNIVEFKEILWPTSR